MAHWLANSTQTHGGRVLLSAMAHLRPERAQRQGEPDAGGKRAGAGGPSRLQELWTAVLSDVPQRRQCRAGRRARHRRR